MHHALITGAGTGIGAAVSHLLASQGMALSLLGRRPEPLEAVQQTLASSGSHTTAAYPCDVTDRAQVDAITSRARARVNEDSAAWQEAQDMGGAEILDIRGTWGPPTATRWRTPAKGRTTRGL